MIIDCIDEIIAANGNAAQILTAIQNQEKAIKDNKKEPFLLAKSMGFPTRWKVQETIQQGKVTKRTFRNPYGHKFQSKVKAMESISENPEGNSLPSLKRAPPGVSAAAPPLPTNPDARRAAAAASLRQRLNITESALLQLTGLISGMKLDIESLESDDVRHTTKPLVAKVTAKKGKRMKRMSSENSDSDDEYLPTCKISSSHEF